MNCKPYDVAYVCRVDRSCGISNRVTGEFDPGVRYGTVVRVTRLQVVNGTLMWLLEEELHFTSRWSDGTTTVWHIYAIGDSYLKPLRDPGDDAVDEMVQRVGKAPRSIVFRSES